MSKYLPTAAVILTAGALAYGVSQVFGWLCVKLAARAILRRSE